MTDKIERPNEAIEIEKLSDDDEIDERYPFLSSDASTGKTEVKYLTKGEARKREKEIEDNKKNREQQENTFRQHVIEKLLEINRAKSFDDLKLFFTEVAIVIMANENAVPVGVVNEIWESYKNDNPA